MSNGFRAPGTVPAELAVLPLAVLSTSVIFDFIHLIGASPVFSRIAYSVILSGLIGGGAASFLGWVDWLMLPVGSRARKIALAHLVIYGFALAIYGLALFVRGNDLAEPEIMSTVFSTVGAGVALVGVAFGSEIYARTREPQDSTLHIVAGVRR